MENMQNTSRWGNYLSLICAQSGIPFHALALADFDKFETKMQVNQHLFEQIRPRLIGDATTGLPEGLKSVVFQISTDQRKSHLETLRSQWQRKLDQAQDISRQVDQLVKEAAQLGRNYQKAIALDIGAELSDAFAKINAAGVWKYVTVNGDNISFESVNDCVMTHKHPQAGVDLQVNLGKIALKINWREARLWSIRHVTNKDVHGYWHPHIASNGVICWGNAAELYATEASLGRWDKVLETLWVLLGSYNPDSPYRRLDEFEAAGIPQDKKLIGEYWVQYGSIPHSRRQARIDRVEVDNGEIYYLMEIFMDSEGQTFYKFEGAFYPLDESDFVDNGDYLPPDFEDLRGQYFGFEAEL